MEDSVLRPRFPVTVGLLLAITGQTEFQYRTEIRIPHFGMWLIISADAPFELLVI